MNVNDIACKHQECLLQCIAFNQKAEAACELPSAAVFAIINNIILITIAISTTITFKNIMIIIIIQMITINKIITT